MRCHVGYTHNEPVASSLQLSDQSRREWAVLIEKAKFGNCHVKLRRPPIISKTLHSLSTPVSCITAVSEYNGISVRHHRERHQGERARDRERSDQGEGRG